MRSDRVSVATSGRIVGGGLGSRGHGHEGRPQDAVAELVAAPDDLDDLALGPSRARDVHDGLVLAGIEWRPRLRGDRLDALTLEERAQLPVDRGDTLDPAVGGELRRPVVDGKVEVVSDGEDLADEVLPRESEHLL